MNQKDLQQILDDHKKWINDDGGKRADLRDSDLSDSYLRGADLRDSDLRGSDLRGADLRGSYLRGSDLRDSDLSDSYLRGADLRDSDLRGSDLRGADLSYSDLRGSRGISPEQCQPLLLLQYQVGKIRAFMVEVADVNDNPDCDCGAGINLATLDWCLKTYRGELQEGKFRLLLCEFTAADIVAIPHASDGKFRVRRCKVIKEIDASEWVKTEA